MINLNHIHKVEQQNNFKPAIQNVALIQYRILVKQTKTAF